MEPRELKANIKITVHRQGSAAARGHVYTGADKPPNPYGSILTHRDTFIGAKAEMWERGWLDGLAYWRPEKLKEESRVNREQSYKDDAAHPERLPKFSFPTPKDTYQVFAVHEEAGNPENNNTRIVVERLKDTFDSVSDAATLAQTLSTYQQHRDDTLQVRVQRIGCLTLLAPRANIITTYVCGEEHRPVSMAFMVNKKNPLL